MREFLERYVDGYLFCDLRSMAAIRKLPKGQKYGAVGYPMVMTALAGIELLGALTAPQKFKIWRGGDSRFKAFWENYMYPGDPVRQSLANLVYQLVRDGLAHTYLAKPVITVTKHHDGRHLSRISQDQICVDALSLADDLDGAYFGRVKPRLSEASFLALMQQQLDTIRKKYSQQVDGLSGVINKIPIGAPSIVGGGQTNIGTSPITRVVSQINSPSVQKTFKK